MKTSPLPNGINVVALVLAMVLGLALPVDVPAQSYPPLRESHDAQLQAALDAQILAQPGFEDVFARRRAGAVVVDVSDLEHPRVAWYNPDVMLYAASLPKIAIVLGAFVEIDAGRMPLDDETREQLVAMVKTSSNSAASAVLAKVGIERLAEILEDPAHGRLYDREHGGGLWVGKPYGKAPAWKRDPLNGLSHGATALSAARFYYGVMNRSLIDERHLPLLREMFGEPGIEHKFVKGLKGRQVDIYRKSGTWRTFHADSAIVARPEEGVAYIAVGIGEGPNEWEGLITFIKLVDDVMSAQAR